jgi:DNA-binding beta-propeller fold protein YncE
MDRREFLATVAGVPLSMELAPSARATPKAGRTSAFVTADLEARIVVVDAATGRLTARIPTLGGPRSIETIDDVTAVVAHTAFGRVSLIDTSARRVRGVLEGLFAPRYTAARAPLAYITDSTRRQVATIDVHDGRVLARADVPGPARHVTLTPDGEEIWTSLGSRARLVALLDARTARRPRLIATFEPPFLAHDVVAAPDGEHVWLTSGNSHRLAVYARGRRRPVAVFSAGAPPQHITFAGSLALVASGRDGTVRVHRLNGDLVGEAKVPVGSYNVTYAAGTAVTPSLSRGTVAVLDRGGHPVAVRTVARAAHDACVVVH